MQNINPYMILGIIAIYFLVLIAISFFTSKGSDNEGFFNANKKSPWLLVAIGMIGASLSGVTFISVPGKVGAEGANMNFSYMQMVFGYLLGYFFIAMVLLPIYYKYNLTSIYGYLKSRFGNNAYKTGAGYFILSRVIGSSLRLYLVAIVFQNFVFGPLGVPFWLTVGITILLIWLYTFRGGIKTIVVTDTFQTVAMLSAVVITIFSIKNAMNIPFSGITERLAAEGYSKLFYFENGWSDPNNFFKQFFSGALITIVMTGLDQDMMQKNLTCKSLPEAQKNIFLFSIILVFANLLFLSLGGLLYIYSDFLGLDIPAKTDLLYPTLAFYHLPTYASVVFILGLIAAAYSSADSALTSLTTSFCVDFLDMEESGVNEENNLKRRKLVHIAFSIILFIAIIIFEMMNNDAVINNLFIAAGYTYGPLLGLFTFGIFTNRSLVSKAVLPICLISPLLTYLIDSNSALLLNGFQFGFLLLALNGILTFLGLWLFSSKN
jgi:Na+/proline symporter